MITIPLRSGFKLLVIRTVFVGALHEARQIHIHGMLAHSLMGTVYVLKKHHRGNNGLTLL